MPTYQYRCTSCERQLEIVQKFTDPSLTECPECSGALKKVFNAVGVVFKGSGFYRTDSRNASNTDTAAKGKSENGSSDSGSTDSGKKDSGKKDSGSKEKVSASKSESSGSSSSGSDSKPKAAATAS